MGMAMYEEKNRALSYSWKPDMGCRRYA